jgi:hypothetical protein
MVGEERVPIGRVRRPRAISVNVHNWTLMIAPRQSRRPSQRLRREVGFTE